MNFTTRFAPSPTGPLHLGHAYSALLAHDRARAAGGRFLLRIDDIDQSRARAHWEDQIYDDLHWLGIVWDGAVRRQSDHIAEYQTAIARLSTQGLTYPCRCTRRDIREAASAPQEGAPVIGPDGMVYPGTCRARAMEDSAPTDAIRLDMARALDSLPALPTIIEIGPDHAGSIPLTREALLKDIGDPVLARPNMGASYHLSVVVDDAAQGVTHVIRGADLFDAAKLQAVLIAILGYEQPVYLHHDLIRDEAGKRLAKRDDARAIAKYRADGLSPQDIRRRVGL